MLVGFCALLLAGLWSLAAVRLLGFDSTRRGNLIATFLPWFLLPAYPLLVGGLLLRRMWLFLGALGLVIAHLVWVMPELPSHSELSPAVATAPKLRVINNNVLFSNPRIGDLFDEMAATNPDVVTFHEMEVGFYNSLAAHPLASELPHWHSNVHGTLIMSRYPFLETGLIGLDEDTAPTLTIDVDGERVRLASVHPTTPIRDFRGWNQALADLTAFAEADSQRLIILGDFNATMQHQPFRELLERADLRDGHNERGEGWGGTWPMGDGREGFGPPLRIDHILVGPDLEVVTFEDRFNPGSDHRALIADIALVN